MVYKVTVKVIQSLWEVTHSYCVVIESYYENTKNIMTAQDVNMSSHKVIGRVSRIITKVKVIVKI